MKHSQAVEFWKEMASSNPTEVDVKINPKNDNTAIDADFIMKYADNTSEILDLASGTGLAINKYYKRVGHIDAVEKFQEFTKFIVDAPNVSVLNEDIIEFTPTKQYDLVTMFGVMQYFDESEARILYEKYKACLKQPGKLIVKNQFGVKEDVLVSGISKELGKPYLSQYRHIDKEVNLLKSAGFKNTEIVDIYPPEANRWDNTHFYAVIASTEDK